MTAGEHVLAAEVAHQVPHAAGDEGERALGQRADETVHRLAAAGLVRGEEPRIGRKT